MLADLVEQGVRPLVSNLKTQLTQLNTDTVAYCADISQADKLTAAENAWLSVMETVQQLQAMEFGPSADTNTGLKSFYAWEEASPLNIDLAIAANTQSDAGLPGINNRKELTAIEYILFSPGTITNTASQNSDMQNWITATADSNADIQNAAIQNDRCDYAKLVTANLANKATDFETSWNAYSLASEVSTKQAAANEVTDALFFADKQIKDAKVKAALPQASGENFDALKLESQFANVSKTHLINNLVGLKRIFTANDNGHGLDDYLASANQADVAIKMIDQIDAAIDNLEEIEGSIVTAVSGVSNSDATCINLAGSGLYSDTSSDIDVLCAFQYTIKQFTDTLKGDFIIATKFTTPASASGDND
jgi:predicted lipoprotein